MGECYEDGLVSGGLDVQTCVIKEVLTVELDETKNAFEVIRSKLTIWGLGAKVVLSA
jgi:hypothetical protein